MTRINLSRVIAMIFVLKFSALCVCRASQPPLAYMNVTFSFPGTINSQKATIINQLGQGLHLDTTVHTVAEQLFFNGSKPANSTLFCPGLANGYACEHVIAGVNANTGLSIYKLRAIVSLGLLDLIVSGSSANIQISHPYGSPHPTILLVETTSDTTEFSPWTHKTYPQDNYVKQSSICVAGVSCNSIPQAPPMAYQHTSVIYQSWTLENILEHKNLCVRLSNNGKTCDERCLVDTTCLRPSNIPSTSTWGFLQYYGQFPETILFTTMDPELANDDGKIDASVPTLTASETCPGSCCGSRRRCMRTHDNLGQVVPLNRSYILTFGGRIRYKQMITDAVTGLDMDSYLNCESLIANAKEMQTYTPSLGSCDEAQFGELWRYDTVQDTWEYIKPNTEEELTTAASVADLFPTGRYGHAAALVEISPSVDPDGYRRKYMYIFGGISNSCLNGLCFDLWRYDIPWAAEAAWPTGDVTTIANYKRGNSWKKLASCPYGGRFRHSMVATEKGDSLYIYGGQMDAAWDDRLLVYHIDTGVWESLDTAGYRYFTRSIVNYEGKRIETNLTDFSIFNSKIDKVGQLGYYTQMGSYIDYPSLFPAGRGDMCMIAFTDREMINSTYASDRVLITSGFRTYSMPYPKPNAVDTPYPTLPYYLDDSWVYDSNSTIWKQVFVTRDKRSDKIAPEPRRGSASVVMPGSDIANRTDDLLVLMGGNRADNLFGDIWVLNHRGSSRKWMRIDDKIPGSLRPPNVTYHTLSHDVTTGKFFLYGGLRWTPTNLTESDAQVDIDKNCFMAARGIIKTACTENPSDEGCALSLAKQQIVSACNIAAAAAAAAAESGLSTDSSTVTTAFCCDSIPSFSGINRLSVLASTCTAECQSKSFVYETTLSFGEGMWVLDPYACENACSGHGNCKFSQCICEPGWKGSDCSIPVCPGSFCYIDSRTIETRCNECSGNGICDSNGLCQCSQGFTGSDCSTIPAGNSCTRNGQVLPDFPVNQCVCEPTFSGRDCEFQLCLNNCSSAGICMQNGACNCSRNFYGEDCSVYMPTASGNGRYGEITFALIIATYLALA